MCHVSIGIKHFSENLFNFYLETSVKSFHRIRFSHQNKIQAHLHRGAYKKEKIHEWHWESRSLGGK